MDAKCKKCRFRAGRCSGHGCDYISITGHARGCPPGKDCTRFEKGKRAVIRIQEPPPIRAPEEDRDVEEYLASVKRRIAALRDCGKSMK